MLTEVKLKALKPKTTLYRAADSAGLCIEVAPTGSKLWRYRYRFDTKPKMLSFGPWPLITLAVARSKRDEARRLLLDGINPMERKRGDADARQRKARSLFPFIAAEWLAHKKKSVAADTYRKAQLVVEGDLVPALRRHSIETLATKDCTKALRDIAVRAPNLATKARQYLYGIVDYAIKEGLREDGRLLSLRGVIPTYDKGHIPAITKPSELGQLLRAIDAYPAPLTRAALQLASLTAMRPAIVASAQWAHIDMESAEWHVPASMMKTGNDHIVPLPTQAVVLLREMMIISGTSPYVFPSPARQKTPHLSRDALSKALRKMGFQGKHATHGFRGTLRTLARERQGVKIDVLEAQLAHTKRGDVQKAYDRTTFDDQRREVMQAWADYLDLLRDDSQKVTVIRRRASANTD